VCGAAAGWLVSQGHARALLSPRHVASTSEAAMVDIHATSCLPSQLHIWFTARHAIWVLPKQRSKDTALQARVHRRRIICLENPKLTSKRVQLWYFYAVKSITLLLF